MSTPRQGRTRKGLELTLSEAARDNLTRVAAILNVPRSVVADVVFEALATSCGALIIKGHVRGKPTSVLLAVGLLGDKKMSEGE